MDLRHNSTPTQPASQGLAQHGLYNAGGYNYLNYRLGLLLKRHRDQSRLPNFAYACLKRLGYTKFDQIRYARRLTYLLYGLPVEYGLAPAILTSWISKPSNQQFLQMRQIIIWDINNHNQEKPAANN
ncbi:hypothetical protein CONCODRAFT_80630 [Conidiobolus coronatus NRRL 28638]|uniref:Uncharacterized protein n=1 Tax=Conidiobolus coronatus (strain ATCC 28846 / CBS 209.66 / NRRL 28638) TaxID=796925 RepID=A0A137NTD1_CONC2|nr:hypothetical protein CONCODRAFT_80630 [Conidiobolus coronatus NRRL 28638]|eukprot:KXN65982.1 hypothetical protein CONCODRAFT_80630 [Conidiobolus coronatus NRRL 28638]